MYFSQIETFPEYERMHEFLYKTLWYILEKVTLSTSFESDQNMNINGKTDP